MAKQSKEVTLTLGGQPVTFSVQQLPARRALKLMHRIVRYASPAFAHVSMDFANMRVEDLGKALDDVLKNINEDDMSDITERLMEGVSVNKRPLADQFDVLFQGETLSVFKLWRFVLEVNYQDFFGALSEGAAAFRAKMRSQSLEQSERSGPSGVSSAMGGQN